MAVEDQKSEPGIIRIGQDFDPLKGKLVSQRPLRLDHELETLGNTSVTFWDEFEGHPIITRKKPFVLLPKGLYNGLEELQEFNANQLLLAEYLVEIGVFASLPVGWNAKNTKFPISLSVKFPEYKYLTAFVSYPGTFVSTDSQNGKPDVVFWNNFRIPGDTPNNLYKKNRKTREEALYNKKNPQYAGYPLYIPYNPETGKPTVKMALSFNRYNPEK